MARMVTSVYRREVRWPQYDVSADGQRSLMARKGTQREPAVVVTTWLAGALAQLKKVGGAP